MLNDWPVHASLATADLDRARAWYAEKLGLHPDPEVEGLLLFRDGGAMFSVYPSESAGTAQNTTLMRNVTGLREMVANLRARGVVFEEYDLGPIRTIDGIAEGEAGELLAWFRDADGNIIGLSEMPDDPMPLGWSPMIAAADIDRARRFYEWTLGFTPAYASPAVATYRSAETTFVVYATSFAGTARNTVAVWRVADLRSEVAELRSRGVAFEDYDFGDAKTVDGILDEAGELNAWFRDSEGNILALAEVPERG